MEQSGQRRPLMYVANHGTDDPTLATLPFLVAVGAGSAEIDCCIALLGEAANLAKPGMIEAVHGVGFPPLRELVEKVRDFEIPVYV
jgi:predicted peroxiredoxin